MRLIKFRPPAIRDGWPFKLFDKSSASTSLLIKIKGDKPDEKDACPRKTGGGNIPVVIKSWCRRRPGRAAVFEEKLWATKKISIKILFVRWFKLIPNILF